MRLTDADVRAFQDACSADGFELSDEQARFYALRFMRLFEILGRPLPGELATSKQNATIEERPVEKAPPSPSQ